MAPMDPNARVALQEDIIRLGEAAHDPELPEETRKTASSEFQIFLERTTAYALLPALVALIQPNRVKTWLRPHILRELSLLPLRPRGVRNTVEFVLSVHPTTRVENGQSKDASSRGPTISPEALGLATRLMSSPPRGIPPTRWFEALAPQLLSLLDGQGGLEMVKVASFIIGFGILGRVQYGAMGMPGWQALAEPILGNIDPTLGWNPRRIKSNEEGVTLMRAQNVLVSATEVAVALRRLASLLSSHPNPNLSRRLLRNMLLPLWSLASWPVKGQELEDYCAPAGFLLHILLQLSLDGGQLTQIADNLMCRGGHGARLMRWKYVEAPYGGIQIEKTPATEPEHILATSKIIDQKKIDYKVNAFMDIVKFAGSSDGVGIPDLFLTLCKRWLRNEDETQPQEIITSVQTSQPTRSFEDQIIDAKVMQGMIEAVPNKLVEDSRQVLELGNNVLHRASRNENVDNDDTVSIALSLFNLVFTSQSFKASSMAPNLVASIKESLSTIAKTQSEASMTAQNLLMLLEFKLIEPDSDDAPPSTVSDQTLEDRRTYKLALSYITSPDSPPPVRAEGLDLLTRLIAANSPIVDVPTTMILVSSLIQDEEEYIYLRAIRSLIELSITHPRTVMNGILERYFDANEELSLDARLRLGEALLQVIEKAGETFTGETARHVSEGLLALGGRRGYRPKTEEGKKKRLATQKNRNKEAEEVWEGPVPQLEDIPEDTDEDAFLNQVVQGWEGKRGEEDVRIRASALSIFGTAIETNIAGMGAALVRGGVDLSINILPLEPEPEKAILRRAAIMIVMSLIRALDKAKGEGKNLGFGFAGQSLEDVLRILKYISDTDNDGLVRQYAKDVMEGLGDWQMKQLFESSSENDVSVQLGELRGLSLGSGNVSGGPRIEEIE